MISFKILLTYPNVEPLPVDSIEVRIARIRGFDEIVDIFENIAAKNIFLRRFFAEI